MRSDDEDGEDDDDDDGFGLEDDDFGYAGAQASARATPAFSDEGARLSRNPAPGFLHQACCCRRAGCSARAG